jgi:hypothetical protein
MRLTPNIRKKISYLFGISTLENNTEHLTSFLKIFRSPTALGSAQALWQTPPGAVHSSVVQTRPDAAEASVEEIPPGTAHSSVVQTRPDAAEASVV